MKIATFGQVIPNKLNYLGIIICLVVAKKICDLTYPLWARLGTHWHPWELPSGYLERANFFVFWAISNISKANIVSDKF